MLGEGFHALHWNMLSCIGGCIDGVRGFLFGRVGRVVGGWILCFGRVWVVGVAGRWSPGPVESHSLGFFRGCCDSVCVGGLLRVRLWVVVGGLLRVLGLCSGGVGVAVCLGVGWVCLVRRVRALGAVCCVEASGCTMFVTNVSSSPVIT